MLLASPTIHATLRLRVAFVAGALAVFPISAAAVEPTALQSEFDVEVYSQKGATTGCGLSFLTAWVNSEQHVLAATGTLNFFAAERSGIGSTLKVRATLDNRPQALSFAWVGVPGSDTTKGFIPLSPDQTGPFFSFVGKPDRQGLLRLRSAAQSGFSLGLSIVGLPLDETVILPAAPPNVLTRLDTCAKALASRQAELEAR